MASIKVMFSPSSAVDREGTICYQINHDRKSRRLDTDYRLFACEWNEKRSMVVVNDRSDRREAVTAIREQIAGDVERLNRVIRRLDGNGLSYTATDVVDEYRRYVTECCLSHFMAGLISKMRQNGRVRTSETYMTTLNSFRRFLNGGDIGLDCLNAELMEAYEAWNRQRGVSSNTISFYNRILRAVYNRAVDNDLIDDRRPFRHVYTGVDKTVKRALPLAVVREIKKLDLTRIPSLDYARDMFIMSFMLRGMSFIDMAYLRKSDLTNGYITYRRRKTGQRLTIAWTKEMQAILDKYPENKSDYLLPVIRTPGINDRWAYRNVGYNINYGLKAIARMVGVTMPLTLYVARHSWASAAKAKGVPLSVISEGMGHDSESTTQIYLASLDASVVDRANSLILSSI
ncbi:MAG: site-specific integrase [Bacteroides sp.]|nr:site-specific integrase [Bacteroides sp.]